MFPHLPMTCKEFSLFISVSNIDGIMNKGWITSNSKKCPQCNIDIEKNAGCKHMTCKMCSHQFCWLCFGNWVGHSPNKCVDNQQRVQLVSRDKKIKIKKKIIFFLHLKKLKETFVKKKENSINVKNHLLKNCNSGLADKMSQEEFKEYILFLTELEAFLFIGENYSCLFTINSFEKNLILKKIKEIYQKIVTMKLPLLQEMPSHNIDQIHKKLTEIKENPKKKMFFEKIKPLMNDIVRVTKKKKYSINEILLE